MADSCWKLWRDDSRDPSLNMAVDELLLNRSGDIGAPLLRIYGWDRPAVSIGFVQAYEAAPAQGYTVVRRPTGGGVVFHDHDLTYTVVVPAGHAICGLDRTESYRVFHDAVQAALRHFGVNTDLAQAEIPKHVDRAFMQCFTTPTRYDVMGDGRKFAGAAQRRTREGILHQGSIDLDASGNDGRLLADALVGAFRQSFAIEFEEYRPDGEFMAAAGALAAGKYATENWNIHKTV
jgi:lipoate-protein ligase A